MSTSERVHSLPYDSNRLKKALVASGVQEGGLERYIERAGNSQEYYRFSGDSTVNDLAIDVLKGKYLSPSETGPLQMWDRVARAMASVEEPEQQEKWYQEFMGVLKDFSFIPGGRINHGAGREEVARQPTLSNCYVIPITWAPNLDGIMSLSEQQREAIYHSREKGLPYKEVIQLLKQSGLTNEEIKSSISPPDSVEGIYQHMTEAAFVYRSGGGVGTDLSVLRPKGSHVNSTMQKAPGPTGFMHLLSESTEAIAQEERRGALMLTLRVDHPDILEFISIKSDSKRSRVKYANISVLVTDEFMEAVEADSTYNLSWTNDDPMSANYGKKYSEKTLRAKDVWDKIIANAHMSAEPGVIFWDKTKRDHNVEYATPLVSTNPCGEQPLAAYTACNLGNINLLRFVDQSGSFDFKEFDRVTRISTRFLDNVITYNEDAHALNVIRHAVTSDRRTGLGLTGLGSALIAMKVKYDTEEGLDTRKTIEKIKRTRIWGKDSNELKQAGKISGKICEACGNLMVSDGNCYKCAHCKTSTGGCGAG